ncbi:uncharacterized protein LOC119396037 [Rhipicephalus sanguineus]|uniref:uncharacterized protein LOC119396037 n=1 Tax=Rhipicephalus sanguineus TaxID=34632 RepID=UPI0020C26B17|nr:uncharacterized protein LOC119396037 [Rhipicephalus sanguineus]
MSRRQLENVKRETHLDMDSAWEEFPLDNIQSNPSECWSPSQVTNKQVEERTPPVMPCIKISNAHAINIYVGDPKQLPNVLTAAAGLYRSAIDDRPAENSRRRAEDRKNTRYSATGRYNTEDCRPSRSRKFRCLDCLDHNRRDRNRSRNRSLGPGRRYHDTPPEENDPSWNPSRRRNDYRRQ